ncbi:MAG: TetR/AcrR family transcriptional regulator [Pseudohongiella sp.]|uniref:TetR/AcrR family transcriptional regulator n=1 Tax=Pseudohongiella sp. TaxID=1979412 RepID=UPI0034A0A793
MTTPAIEKDVKDSKQPDTKQKLLDTASELIWKNNYDTVGIAEICKNAGVTKGAFYHHFTSKADLFLTVCASQCEDVTRKMDDMLSSRFTPLEQLENVMAHLLEKQCCDGVVEIRGCPLFTAGSQGSCEDQGIRDTARDMSTLSINHYTRLVGNLAAGKYLNHIPDAEQTGRLIHQFIEGLWLHGRMHQDLEQLSIDLREGLYRVLDVKQRYRVSSAGHDTPKLASVR